jgi:hypothetical protein
VTRGNEEKPLYFFNLESPHDMLAKARRELARFEAEPCVDHAFNFLVTVYHIKDWAAARGLDVGGLMKDPDFGLCRLACNQGKHLRLTGGTVTAASDRQYGTHQDSVYSGPEEYAIVAGETRIGVATLARRVLATVARHLGE